MTCIPLAPALRLLVASLLALAVPAFGQSADHDRWYVLHLAGTRAGWMHTLQSTANGRITTTTRTELTIRRGAAALSVAVRSEFVETADGRPVRMLSSQSMGAAPVVSEWTFGPTDVTQSIKRGRNRPVTTVLSLPEGPLMAPAAAARHVAERIAAGDGTIAVRTLDPTIGAEPVTVTHTVLGREEVPVQGRPVAAVKLSTVVSAVPGVTTISHVDDQGLPLVTSTSLGGLQVTTTLADQAVARAPADGAAPELMHSTLVRPDRPIERARQTRRASYLLSVPAGHELPELPTAGSQRTQRLSAQAARVRVLPAEPVVSPEADPKAHLAANASLDFADPAVARLVARALKNAPADPAARAEALRGFVSAHIRTKDLGVGFAGASEVATSRQGDCTEHGVLLAAMLRADGIPSRVVTGLIYVDRLGPDRGVFGYHMWTQALLDLPTGRSWVDLDATLPPGAPFDATHIALGVSDLEDGKMPADMAGLASLLGRLSIIVEAAE
ncbi:MAG TPA: transglutaminase-like domain-containing protein [Phycisphaerales bacterium]|nr:transglutaminase-like domain-containing protein [Phycisphaerales bacterium]